MATRLVRDLFVGKVRQLITISPDATVQEALQSMATKRISALPVMAGGPNLLGIISERDYIRRVVPKRIAPWDILVKDIMTEKIIYASMDNTVRECMDLMVTHRFRHLPVLDGTRPVAMLSISDLLQVLRAARIDFPPA